MYEKEFEVALKLIKKAGSIILESYEHPLDVETKGDGSPVTVVDKKVDKLLRDGLSKAFPSYALLTEESEDDLSRLDNDFVWIIDPIDGTKSFIARDYQFVTLIALVYKHEPVISLIMEPRSGEIYYAKKGEGAYLLKGRKKTQLHVSNKVDKNLTVLVSPYNKNPFEIEYLNKNKAHFKTLKPVGAAYKACLIASGKAEVCYRFSFESKEWDTCAPQLLVEEAGGYYFDGNGFRMKYNRQDVVNHDGYMMVNDLKNIF